MEGLPSIDVSNVLSEEKRQQVIALGRLGWPLRRIQQETGIRRETAGAYLKAAGIAVRAPGGWGRRSPAKPANEVSTDLTARPSRAKTGQRCPPTRRRSRLPGRSPTGSACEPYFDFIELSLSKGRNAKAIYQDLVDNHGFTGALRQRQALRWPVARAAQQSRPVRSSSRHPARKRRSITAAGRWCAIRTLAVTGARACSYSRWATAARPFACSPSSPARARGPNCTSRRSAGWAASPHGRARQPQRRRTQAGHLRSRLQSAVSRRAGSLWRRRAALPRRRSRSQRESRARRRARQEHALEGPAL